MDGLLAYFLLLVGYSLSTFVLTKGKYKTRLPMGNTHSWSKRQTRMVYVGNKQVRISTTKILNLFFCQSDNVCEACYIVELSSTNCFVSGIVTRLELDTRKQLSGRMFFLSREDESNLDLALTLTREQQHCITELVYLIVSLLLMCYLRKVSFLDRSRFHAVGFTYRHTSENLLIICIAMLLFQWT